MESQPVERASVKISHTSIQQRFSCTGLEVISSSQLVKCSFSLTIVRLMYYVYNACVHNFLSVEQPILFKS